MHHFVCLSILFSCLCQRLVLSNSHGESVGIIDAQYVHNTGHQNEQRGKRAVTLADLGAAAIKVMVRGASEVPAKNQYALIYSKPGNIKAAIRDFKEIGTVNNRKVLTKDGGVYFEGVVGDKTVRLRINDKRYQGRPTILAFDPTKRGQYKSQVQVVYKEQETVSWH